VKYSETIGQAILQFFDDSSLLLSQIKTLTACVLGLIAGQELSLSAVGTFMPGDVAPKHNIKRVDRWCGNKLVTVDPVTGPMLVALGRRSGTLLVSVDWTKIDNFQALVFSVTTGHGRAVPVYWEVIDPDKTLMKKTEIEAVERFHALVPPSIRVTILADRGFDDVPFILAVAKRFHYVIRLARNNSMAATVDGDFKQLESHLTVKGTPVDFGDVFFTKEHRFQTRVVAIQEARQIEPWFLATNVPRSAHSIVQHYARRFDCEHAFRDWKDDHHGWKLGAIFSKSPIRLSRLLIVAAVAYLVLVLVGLFGESRGLHRGLQSNSVKKHRTKAVWRVGFLLLMIGRRIELTVEALFSFIDNMALVL
jgi:Transposase DDE domain